MTRLEHANITVPDIDAAIAFLSVVAPDFRIRHDALAEQAKADENACISLSLERKAHDGVDGLAISVSDNGPGIPTGLQEKVFEAYYTSKSTQNGTGLGLTLCRDLMDDLGGHLSLTSRVGQTTFRLWLPACQSDTRPVATDHAGVFGRVL